MIAMNMKDLNILGLTKWESRIYINLKRYGFMRVCKIARMSNVPTTKVYEVLEMLKKKVLAKRIVDKRYGETRLIRKEQHKALTEVSNFARAKGVYINFFGFKHLKSGFISLPLDNFINKKIKRIEREKNRIKNLKRRLLNERKEKSV